MLINNGHVNISELEKFGKGIETREYIETVNEKYIIIDNIG
jgi:hypothetical protein